MLVLAHWLRQSIYQNTNPALRLETSPYLTQAITDHGAETWRFAQ